MSLSESLLESYKAIFMRLGCRPLTRAREGYDIAWEREKRGPPSLPVVTERGDKLLGKLGRVWGQAGDLGGAVVKTSFLCGQLSHDHFLRMGANLILANMMDYYTVDLWVEVLAPKLLSPCCFICSTCRDLMVCSGCRQLVYCSVTCQRRHWRSGHKEQCRQLAQVYQTDRQAEEEEVWGEQKGRLVEIFRLSMMLVEEAEHQLYDDNQGQEWLLLENYHIPPYSKCDLVLNIPLRVYHPYLFQSAKSFRPRRQKEKKYLDRWGIPWELEFFELDPENHGKLRMIMHNISLVSDGMECQQAQFVDKLIARKLDILKDTKLDPNNSPDFVLRIELMGTEPKVWRKFQCPSAVPLFTLADKILTPIMGWVRNFHAYTFVDTKDGAHIGPSKMHSIDTGHIKSHFYKLMDDSDVQLGQLVKKKGDSLVWVYDLGDYWEHEIVLEKVVKPTGVELQDGEMSCPPENEKKKWQEEVLAKLPPKNQWDGPCLTKIDKKLKEKLYVTVHTMVNIQESGQYIFKNHCMYDPYHFDLEHHEKMLRNALASNLRSKTEGGKVFNMDMEKLLGKEFKKKKTVAPHRYRSGCAVRETDNGMFESVDLRRDEKQLALCANCGSTRNLMMCRQCKQVYYCGEECHREHWFNGGHMQECKLLKKIHKNVKKEESNGGDGHSQDGILNNDDLKREVDKIQSRGLFDENNVNMSQAVMLIEKLEKKGIFFKNENLQLKFKVFVIHFNDEELALLGEVENFSKFNQLFNNLTEKYKKQVRKTWSSVGEEGEDETGDESTSSKLTKKKWTKSTNKRKLRRKML